MRMGEVERGVINAETGRVVESRLLRLLRLLLLLLPFSVPVELVSGSGCGNCMCCSSCAARRLPPTTAATAPCKPFAFIRVLF